MALIEDYQPVCWFDKEGSRPGRQKGPVLTCCGARNAESESTERLDGWMDVEERACRGKRGNEGRMVLGDVELYALRCKFGSELGSG